MVSDAREITIMTETMPRMTIAEMGQTLAAAKYVSDWGHGGDMRSFMGEQPREPSTDLERAAMIAFDVAVIGEPKFGAVGGVPQQDRNDLVDLLSNGLRIAIVDERENGTDGRTDVDRARLILTSMSMVKTAREHVDGFQPDALENSELESIRTTAGIDVRGFSMSDVNAIAVGMPDMIADPAAARHVVDIVKGALSPSADDLVDNRLQMADATWPGVVPVEPKAATSLGKGPVEASPATMPRGRDAGR